ncbi:O-acetylhomoserine aminocarboxypropyltransferase/cysteine synthase family protein [Tissierella praeacuta]|uniref:O-acetylhomoserine aminocarboxypropyltransferase/cysteine synthase family protein n=1 Tax=Tissierella praeacuta TaxID=43131 RepID=UPI00289BE4BE|nr:O-acetylhomoserine aminocarboxypropyltransferase/cysteine synthase family protein [Tissierella praeacuta]
MKKETICVHGGYNPRSGEPRVFPIIQSTTYKYEDPDYLADLFDLKQEGHMYSRISNPTVAALEEKVNILEGGVGALAVSSGQSATLIAILNICKSGDHILASSNIYGGTFTLLSVTLKKLGIDVTFVNQNLELEELIKYVRPNTRAIFAETISNPSPQVLDFKKFSNLAKKVDLPLIIDNTFPTPYLCTPFEYGANIIIHSATKYLDGHATSVGGVIVDGGNYNWDNGKFKELTEPDPAYHGIQYVKEFKEKAYITKARVQLLRDLGNCLSPFNAFLINLGIETLHLRIKRHSDNALALAKYLEFHPKISWVNYPKLESNNNYKLAEKYLPLGASGILAFGIKGGKEAAKEFIKNIKLTGLVIHLGEVRTSILHPATTTHRQLSDEELELAGISGDMIRVSVGIENIEDIIKDFETALGN